MKNTHETQSFHEYMEVESDKIYTPIEDYQRIYAGGAFKRRNLNLRSLPKGIRYLGYFFISFFAISTLVAVILSLIF